MKTIKTITSVIALAGLLFISCDNAESKKSKTADKENSETISNDTINKNRYSTDTLENEEPKTMSFNLENGTPITYQIDRRGIVSFDTWDDFNTASVELYEVEKEKDTVYMSRLVNLGLIVKNLRNTTPDWLKTEEVMEDIADIEKEYNELMNEESTSVKETRENIEELIEKFDDLREELNETLKKLQKK